MAVTAGSAAPATRTAALQAPDGGFMTGSGRRVGEPGGSPGEDISRVGAIARAFWTAAKIGWRMEANWTDPLLFFIYSVAKPVSAALILVVMLSIVAGPAAANLRPFVVVGTALWSLVTSGISGLAWSILDDRERYRMLKYIFVSPSDFIVVLLGRGVARIGVGAAGALITLAVGIVLLGVPFEPARINWPVLVLAMVFGLASVVALALLLAAVCLQTRQESWSYPEAFAGAAFLLSGAVFPLAILPAVVQAIGLVLPLGWWIEAARRAFLPDSPSGIGGPGSLLASMTGGAPPSLEACLLALIVTGAMATLAAAVVFRYSVRRAQDRGLLDLTTGS